jgi:hypothetical protein
MIPRATRIFDAVRKIMAADKEFEDAIDAAEIDIPTLRKFTETLTRKLEDYPDDYFEEQGSQVEIEQGSDSIN